MKPVITLSSVRLAYGDRVVLDDVDLTVGPARITALIGPNGSGKSTLLSTMAGLLCPVGGTVTVMGDPPDVARNRVAYVLQETHSNRLLPMSVGEVVTMGRYGRTGLFRRLREPDRLAVDQALERMDVAGLRRRQLGDLSGGQRQRVFVAQALAQQADVLLLDEPVTGLDLISQQHITTAMLQEKAAGRAVVVSTHDLGEAERADTVILLAGRVVAAGLPAEVLTRPHLQAAYGHQLIDLGDTQAMVDEHPHPVAGSSRQDADATQASQRP